MEPLLLTLPYDFEVEQNEDGSAVVTVALAESATQLVSIDCCFMDTGRESVEFTFAIVVTPASGEGEPLVIFDRDEAAPYVPDACRGLVVPTVCNALHAMVEAENPEFVYFSTFQAGVEGPGLRKYNELIVALNAVGYHVIETGTDGYGREFWFLEQINEQDSNNQESDGEESP